MRVVLGIGNPGLKYNFTRHNIGFIILDRLAEKHNLNIDKKESNYRFAGSTTGASPFFLIKPTTYVNLSGAAANKILETLEIPVEEILVVTDDVHLPSGKIRVRKAGGDGGHNGLKSIIYHLESDNFPRLRFGIGNEFAEGELADYVLGKITESEFETIKPAINFSIELIEEFISGGTKQMLDFYSKNVAKLKTDTNSQEERK